MGKIIKKRNKLLAQSYYTPQRVGAYGGIDALQRATRLKKRVVKDWLSYQDAYTLHKPVRRKFTRRRTIVGGMDQQFQADLIDVQKLKKSNGGFVFLLTCIDVLSKFAWVVPLKNKTGQSLVAAFTSIFSRGRKPESLQTDKGKEFLNTLFLKFLKQEGVHHFTTENDDIKASIVERFNRTLKEKMWRYFTRKNTLRYVEVLPQILRGYNYSYHRSIKMAPAAVNVDNQEEVWQSLYGASQPTHRRSPPSFQEGARVRVSKTRRTFKKGYLPSWTEELFTVSRILKTSPLTYALKDDHGEELRGKFYKEEIQKVGKKEFYRVETVMQERLSAEGRPEYLVSWKGYDASFNSWVPKSHLTRYTR